jgi:hypothetical protein
MNGIDDAAFQLDQSFAALMAPMVAFLMFGVALDLRWEHRSGTARPGSGSPVGRSPRGRAPPCRRVERKSSHVLVGGPKRYAQKRPRSRHRDFSGDPRGRVLVDSALRRF